jgi:flagellar transcriptional activator FlhD
MAARSGCRKEMSMSPEQILAEIRETNLSYLMLAQSLIRTDREQALYRLGVSEETANLLANLSPAQVMKLAASSTLLCRFRMDDDLVWGLLTSSHKPAVNEQSSQLHAQILLAGRHQHSA